MHVRFPPILILLVLVIFGAQAPRASADREIAELLAKRGEKALKAKTWEEAEQHYRRSLEEDATFLPARYGLVEALLGAGHRDPAVEELRALVKDADAATALPPAWAALLAKARRRLIELDALGTELDQLIAQYADALVAFAKRWKDKDAQVAIQAIEVAALLHPEDDSLGELQEALRGVGDPGEPLFTGKDLSGWAFRPDVWTLTDGILHGEPPPGKTALTRSDNKLAGDYDVRVEAKVEPKGPVPIFALAGSLLSEYDRATFGMLREGLILWEYPDSRDYREIWAAERATLRPPVDITKFNVYELRFRGDTIHAAINGRVLASYARPPSRASGFVGLVLQQVHVSIRRIDYVRR